MFIKIVINVQKTFLVLNIFVGTVIFFQWIVIISTGKYYWGEKYRDPRTVLRLKTYFPCIFHLAVCVCVLNPFHCSALGCCRMELWYATHPEISSKAWSLSWDFVPLGLDWLHAHRQFFTLTDPNALSFTSGPAEYFSFKNLSFLGEVEMPWLE